MCYTGGVFVDLRDTVYYQTMEDLITFPLLDCECRGKSVDKHLAAQGGICAPPTMTRHPENRIQDERWPKKSVNIL